MSNPHEHPNGGRRGHQARSQTRSRRPGQPSAPTRRGQRRATSICRQDRRLPNSDHEALVAWFVAYWRRHGSDLFSDQPDAEEARIEA